MGDNRDIRKNKKEQQLEAYKVNDKGKALTTNQGLKMSEDEFSLKAGERGPTLLEDFHFREKVTHFDHEIKPLYRHSYLHRVQIHHVRQSLVHERPAPGSAKTWSQTL